MEGMEGIKTRNNPRQQAPAISEIEEATGLSDGVPRKGRMLCFVDGGGAAVIPPDSVEECSITFP